MEKEKLSNLAPGDTCQVIQVTGEDKKIRRRLFDMGVTPQANIYIRKKAPLGDPIEITIRNYELSLRKSEAEAVVVNVLKKGESNGRK